MTRKSTCDPAVRSTASWTLHVDIVVPCLRRISLDSMLHLEATGAGQVSVCNG